MPLILVSRICRICIFKIWVILSACLVVLHRHDKNNLSIPVLYARVAEHVARGCTQPSSPHCSNFIYKYISLLRTNHSSALPDAGHSMATRAVHHFYPSTRMRKLVDHAGSTGLRGLEQRACSGPQHHALQVLPSRVHDKLHPVVERNHFTALQSSGVPTGLGHGIQRVFPGQLQLVHRHCLLVHCLLSEVRCKTDDDRQYGHELTSREAITPLDSPVRHLPLGTRSAADVLASSQQLSFSIMIIHLMSLIDP